MLYDTIFKYKTVVFDKLTAFGFGFDNGVYVYSCLIMDSQFELTVIISPQGAVRTKLTDTDTNDEYTLHLAESAHGTFVGKVRTECAAVLQKIADTCFAPQIFKSAYAAEVIRYVKNKYGNDFEYLWQKFPDNAIVRRSDNQKWYAAILTVAKNKLGLDGEEKTEVIDLRCATEEIEHLVDGKKYFSGYHMNKKHWITICLDGTVMLQEIFDRIDKSYLKARK